LIGEVGSLTLNRHLKRLAAKIVDHTLRERVVSFMENPTVEISGRSFRGLSLEDSPAGKSRHHSYSTGLVEHIRSSTEVSLALCDIAKRIYHININRDVVTAAMLLHDIAKPLTYTEKEDQTYGISPLGDRMDHLTLVVAELIRRGFDLDVIHAVSAHHGYEARPIGPRTVEALVCHIADLCDAKLSGELLRAADFLTRECGGERPLRLTTRQAFELISAKEREGCDGVRRVLENLRNRKTSERSD